MDCEKTGLVHAYHDGELPPEQRASVESHISECAGCRELRAALRRVSQLVAAAPMIDMPANATKRMQQAWWAAQDRGVRRIASWLTAAAAAVIFAAVIFSPTDRVDSGAPSWQVAALTPPMFQDQDEAQDEVIDAAQWIANDLALAMR